MDTNYQGVAMGRKRTREKVRMLRLLRAIGLLILISPLFPILLWRFRKEVSHFLKKTGVLRPRTSVEWEGHILLRLWLNEILRGMSIRWAIFAFILKKMGVDVVNNFLKKYAQSAASELGENFYMRAAKMDDRSLAIVCTSLLERWLALAVLTRFAWGRSEKNTSEFSEQMARWRHFRRR